MRDYIEHFKDRAEFVAKNEGYTGLIKRGITFPYRRPVLRLNNIKNKLTYGSGTSILEKDWDNLIILDACRYDSFLKVAPFDEKYIEKRVTLGSRTPQFLHRTFNDAQLHDTVYVTANPQTLKFISKSKSNEPVFHDTISLLDKWDSKTQTIKPETVRMAAKEAAETYPNKRLLIHFLQPHAPFLGPTATEIRDRTGKTIGGLDPGRDYTNVDAKNILTEGYEDILNRNVSMGEIHSAYQETLALAIMECIPLINDLNGLTAITSDHGELLGERIFPFSPPRWEHPGSIRTPELNVVPWMVFQMNNRKEIISEPPEEQSDNDESKIDKRLKALGYK